MNNPYTSRGPIRDPQLFFNRQRELGELSSFLRGGQSVSIVGPRKIGKTSLFFHLMRPTIWPAIALADNNLFVYLDCEVLHQSDDREIFSLFAEETSRALERQTLAAEPTVGQAIENPSRLTFEGALRRLSRRELQVIFILDEFEQLSTNTKLDVNFFNVLRSVASRFNLVFLTGSARPLIDLTYSGRSKEILSSPFFNIFAPLFLGLLPEEDARHLIRQPAACQQRAVDPELENYLLQLVGRHPLALQIACFHAWETQGDRAEIHHRSVRELDAHFQYVWKNLSASERLLLRRPMDVSPPAQSDFSARQALRNLVASCLLVPQNDSYAYISRAWEEFLNLQTIPPLETTPEQPQPQLQPLSPSRRPAESAPDSLHAPLRGQRAIAPAAVYTPRQSQIGGYLLLELLGRGSMAEVFKGLHPRLQRSVAIKILSPHLAEQRELLERFELEARSVASLKHPHIIQIFDFGKDVRGYYMIMEFIDGTDLREYLGQAGAMPLPLALRLLEKVASALDYAHGRGIVHRDVKPSNILLEEEDADSPFPYRPVLTDFGLAKVQTVGGGITRGGAMLGTPYYMAPELIKMGQRVDHRVDIYALGVIFYQLITGRLPFSGETFAVIHAHLHQPPPDPRAIMPALPSSLVPALQKAMAKDADQRFMSSGAFVEALGGQPE